MRIGFVLSFPAAAAGEGGGIRRLMLAYASLARQVGFDAVDMSGSDPGELLRADLVHLAPADGDTIAVAEVLRRHRRPYVVSPIIDKTQSNLTLNVGVAVHRLARGLVYTHLGCAAHICANAAAICVSSDEEQRRVRRGLCVTGVPSQIVPPILLDEPSANFECFEQMCDLRDFVLAVGDLSNRRKNVLRLIAACIELGHPLVLIGALGNDSVSRQIRTAVASSSNVRYFGMVERPIVVAAMMRCHVFALPSLVESIGLAAVEAGALGARVVITKHGGTRYYFGTDAWYVDPFSVASIAAGVQQAWQAPTNRPLVHALRNRFDAKKLAPVLAAFYSAASIGHDAAALSH
jgi:glycosyltransferase involved in cell wall biosynthesis